MKSFLSVAIILALLSAPGLSLRAQATLTNEDIPKLVKAGLSETLILNLIDQQGSKLSSDPPRLVDLKNDGVGERLIAAVAGRSASREPLGSYGLIQLARAQFSEAFLLDLVKQRPVEIAMDSMRLTELKHAGLTEPVLYAVLKKSPWAEPITSDGVVHLAKAGFSENFIVDVLNRQPGKFTADVNRIVELKQAGVSERVLASMITRSGNRELPPGVEISVRLIDPIDSEKSKEGDEFRANLDKALMLGDEIIAPKGATAKVRLVTQKESGKFTGKTELTVQLASFVVREFTVPVNSTGVTEGSGSRGERTAKSAAAVGAVGAIIGAIAGGGKGAAIGAGAGAAAGAGSQVFMKGQRVRIPSETALTFTTQMPIQLP